MLGAAVRTIGKVLRVAGHFLYEKREFYFCEADCSAGIPDVDTRLPVEVRVADVRDLSLFHGIAPRRKVREFKARLARREIGIIALRDGRIASYVWLTPNDHEDRWLNITVRLDHDECVGYDAYTHPDFRKKGIRGVLHAEERRRALECNRPKLLFWLDKRIYHRAVAAWGRIGLSQRLIGEIVSRRILGVLKLASVSRDDEVVNSG
jgi:GNAT superfamily N-acetyltransferase